MTERSDPIALPTGVQFRNRFIARSLLSSIAGTVGIGFYLLALLTLPAHQWQGFGVTLVAFFPIVFVAQDRVNRRLWGPIVRCLDRVHEGTADASDLLAGFAAASNLPTRGQWIGWFWWALGGAVVATGMRLLYGDGFTWFSTFVMFFAALSGGFLMTVFHFFTLKRLAEPVRVGLAQRAGNPQARGRVVTTRTLGSKLRWAVTGVTFFTLVFAIFCAQVRSWRPVEAHAVDIQRRYLVDLVASVEWHGGQALVRARDEALRLGIAEGFAVLGPEAETVLASQGEILSESEIELIRAVGPDAGDSRGFDSAHVLTWQRIPEDGRIVVAVSTWRNLQGEVWGTRLLFGVLLIVAAAVSMAIAHLLADDVSRATTALRGEVERLAEGDLRAGVPFESEDELGELGRAFERMAGSLRETVGRVASAADRVEARAGEMASVSTSVAAVTADQVSGIRQTTQSMEAINGQVRGITESAQGLNVSVEESSSSMLELGAAGEELNETASVLSSKVNEVSTSIEQMVRSVKQVLENTESLSEASVETSASMGEMATSMREVDSSAEETARLSREVVDSAESGQRKMVQAIEGMEAIRDATETAESVIRGLGTRAREIGAIVDVIDDVADETNLLALNAAIIAAQAGEHGRAFSVVADEIKDLADRVLASTKEIGGQIRAVQEESENAIGAIERGAQSVAGGVDLTAEAGESLEEITRASRESGQRISGIVSAVREQARAASHVVELMERVRGGVEEIASAASEQDKGNEVVFRGAVAMRDVAQQVRGTTEEQARGSGRIRESIEGVREAVEQINEALQEQSAACRSAAEFLEAMHQRTRVNEESVGTLDQVAQDLLGQAEALRNDVQRFTLS